MTIGGNDKGASTGARHFNPRADIVVVVGDADQPGSRKNGVGCGSVGKLDHANRGIGAGLPEGRTRVWATPKTCKVSLGSSPSRFPERAGATIVQGQIKSLHFDKVDALA
jgi:hypothetical protein